MTRDPLGRRPQEARRASPCPARRRRPGPGRSLSPAARPASTWCAVRRRL